jgi:hypothetical protein
MKHRLNLSVPDNEKKIYSLLDASSKWNAIKMPKKTLVGHQGFSEKIKYGSLFNKLYCLDNLAEDVANGGSEEGEDDDDHNGDQDEDQRIFHQTLTFFLRGE